MPLNESQQRTLKEWMRSKAIVQCSACGKDGWSFAQAAYVRALLEASDANLTEDEGGGEASVRQLRVRGGVRCRGGGNSGRVGQREGLVISKGAVT